MTPRELIAGKGLWSDGTAIERVVEEDIFVVAGPEKEIEMIVSAASKDALQEAAREYPI